MEEAKELIITIGREHGTMGKRIADALKEKLCLPIYDKESLLDAVKGTRDYDELNAFYHDRQINSLLYAIAMRENLTHINQVPFEIIKRVIEDRGGIVMDSCGNYLFCGRPNTVRIFLHGSKEIRRKNLMGAMRLSKKQAEKEMEDEDAKRFEFHKYYTNEIWGMSNGYELCLDQGILGTEGCLKVIMEYLKIRGLIS